MAPSFGLALSRVIPSARSASCTVTERFVESFEDTTSAWLSAETKALSTIVVPPVPVFSEARSVSAALVPLLTVPMFQIPLPLE